MKLGGSFTRVADKEIKEINVDVSSESSSFDSSNTSSSYASLRSPEKQPNLLQIDGFENKRQLTP